MTRFAVITIATVTLLLAVAIFFYASALAEENGALGYSSARKEDLALSQQRIEESLAALNQTIRLELDNQKALAEKVTELAAKADLPPPVINTTTIVQPPATVVTVPKPKPVTRAS
jgi:hypothetical protein